MHFERNNITDVRTFDIDKNVYILFIDLDDDKTFVVDEDCKEIGLKFDSSTYVYINNKRIGKLRLPFEGENKNIHFVKYNENSQPEEPFDTGVSDKLVECYLDAEVVVTKYLIEKGFLKVKEESNG